MRQTQSKDDAWRRKKCNRTHCGRYTHHTANLGVALLGPLKQSDHALAPIGAYADDRAASGAHREQLLDALAQVSRPRCGEGVSDRDRAAIRVDATPGKRAEVARDAGPSLDPILLFESGDVCQHLRGKG